MMTAYKLSQSNYCPHKQTPNKGNGKIAKIFKENGSITHGARLVHQINERNAENIEERLNLNSHQN